MARFSRLVVPGLPHHVTQRGNRRQATFFKQDDYRTYLRLLKEECARSGVEIWSYCLMTNHVHLILVPETEKALQVVMRETHRRYTSIVNQREGWTGFLWQGRFGSCVMDEPHTIAAARYIELNPVDAQMTAKAGDYKWSSAAAHLSGKDDDFVKVQPLLEMVPDWQGLLSAPTPKDLGDKIEKHGRTGRPLGSDEFVSGLEQKTGRRLKPSKSGRKPSDGSTQKAAICLN